MSECQKKHAVCMCVYHQLHVYVHIITSSGQVSKLIGSPIGYIGYFDGGKLVNQLRKCPNAVVWFDEVEKAHPDVLTVLLQLFDEGRLTDGHGTVICKDALFLMTSNLASEEIAAHGLKLRQNAQLAAEDRGVTTEGEERERKGIKMTLICSGPQRQIQLQFSRDFKDQVVEPILKV